MSNKNVSVYNIIQTTIKNNYGKKVNVTAEEHEYTGTIVGYDDICNIVLNPCTENLLLDTETPEKRELGKTIIRGSRISYIEPLD